MKTHVIYHANCSDGAAAALIALEALTAKDPQGGEIHLVPAQYGEPPNFLNMRHCRVYILDFSFDRETTLELAIECQLIVLDHHATAEKALEGIPGCVFDMDKCGARLTWEHFHGKRDVPWWVEYIEDRDLWRWKLPYSKVVNAAIRSYGIGLDGLREALLWEDGIANRHLDELTRDGGAILREQEQIVEAHVARAELVPMFGTKVPAVNATVLQSEIAGALAESPTPFAACWFEKIDGTRVWSLRSRKDGVDVGELAKSANGGGHPAAAGFTQKTGDPLP